MQWVIWDGMGRVGRGVADSVLAGGERVRRGDKPVPADGGVRGGC